MADYITDTAALSYGSQIGLNTENASPPTNAYVGVDDQLQVFVASSLASPFIRLFARILLPDGTIVPNDWIYSAGNGRLGQNFYQSIAEGFLLSLTVYGGNATATGQTFVRISLIRGTIAVNGISQVLIQGYATGQNTLSWPNSPLWPSSYGAGNIRSITGTVPSAGSDASESVPLFAIWRLMSFTASFQASAAAGTRYPFLVIDDGTNELTRVAPAATVAANGVFALDWADGFGSTTQAVYQNLPLPRQYFLYPGYRIRPTASGILAADQWYALQYLVEEWIKA